jgi:hypothetical protein
MFPETDREIVRKPLRAIPVKRCANLQPRCTASLSVSLPSHTSGFTVSLRRIAFFAAALLAAALSAQRWHSRKAMSFVDASSDGQRADRARDHHRHR